MTSSALSLALPSCDDAPRLARQAVRGLSGISAIQDDVVLLVSELVTNAVMHSGSEAGDLICVEVERDASTLTISVQDAGRSDASPHLRPASSRGRGGLGLRLVDLLCEHWYSDRHSIDGHTVRTQMSMLPVAGERRLAD